MIIAYRQPSPYDLSKLADFPEVVRSLVQLEAKAPASWHINAIATFSQFRGKGVASQLIKETESPALIQGCNLCSLIVASENINAKNLYEYLGYTIADSLPVIAFPGSLHGGSWLFMTKPIRV